MLSLFTSHKFHCDEFAKWAKTENETIWCQDIYQYFLVKKMGVMTT
jgi:hypothetical protein